MQTLYILVSRTRGDKKLQTETEDVRCSSSTTKLLLRCLEQMLNLEEQDEKGIVNNIYFPKCSMYQIQVKKNA